VGAWEPYTEFTFRGQDTSLTANDMARTAEIADYAKSNPSLQIGIDGTAARSRDQGVNDLRANTIRTALIDAGVPAANIKMGAIGDRDLRREGRISVLFSTAK